MVQRVAIKLHIVHGESLRGRVLQLTLSAVITKRSAGLYNVQLLFVRSSFLSTDFTFTTKDFNCTKPLKRGNRHKVTAKSTSCSEFMLRHTDGRKFNLCNARSEYKTVMHTFVRGG